MARVLRPKVGLDDDGGRDDADRLLMGTFQIASYQERIRRLQSYFFSMETPFLPTSISIPVGFC
jgi:hypothetical protein